MQEPRNKTCPCEEEGRDAMAVEGSGQELDHGCLAIAAPGDVPDADDGHGEGAARTELGGGEDPGEAEGDGGSGE